MLRATFRQLETFVLVAETGSFAGAADRLGVSPAAVSDQVRALERKFGYRLFDRRPGTVPVLNERGNALLRKAPDLLDSANEVASLSVAISAQRVRVGAGDYILEHLLLPNLASFQLEHPETHIEFVRLQSSSEAVQAAHTQRIDLGYVALYSQPNDPMAEFIGTSKPVLLISPNHPAANWRPGLGRMLPMIMPLSGTVLERVLVQILHDAGITEFDVVTRAQRADTMIELAIAGVGAVCLMREHARSAVSSRRLVEIDAPLPPLYRCALRRSHALDVSYLRQVDEFALSLLRSDRAN